MEFKEEIEKELKEVLKKLGLLVEEVQLEHPAEMKHGDYATNVALKVKSQKSKVKSPQSLSALIVQEWRKIGLPDFVGKIEVAPPGFLNIWLKIDYLVRQLEEVLKEGDSFGSSKMGKGKTVVIDYSSPNIAKPFGIGHLRSTNIGQALYNIYKFLGWKTIGDNHLGDWGTQFGKLIYQIKVKSQKSKVKSEEEFLKNLTVKDLEKLYVEFHKEAEIYPELEPEARKWFKKLEDGDSEAKAIWQMCVDISLKEFERIYRLLGVKIDYAYGESFYQDKMEEVLEDAKAKGLLKESQGAKIIEIPGQKVPAMLVKSDGATTYLLRDLAAIKFRRKTWNPDLFIYEVGADQKLHFRQVFACAQLLDYGKLDQFVHVPHGLIRWKKGKFSTRKGETIYLEEVLLQAINKAKELCQKAGVAKDLSKGEKEKVARAVGIGAVKYNDLKQNPQTDIVFDWDQILTLQGNSGPYLQYTYARAQSVLKKANFQFSIFNFQSINNYQFNNEEIAILRTLYKFPEIVVEAAKNYAPNLICNFLYDLAQKFNLFYDKHRILVQSSKFKVQSEFRLLLTAAVGQVIKNGLDLLGIESLERM